jgi:hypothetical protein
MASLAAAPMPSLPRVSDSLAEAGFGFLGPGLGFRARGALVHFVRPFPAQ